MIAEPPLRDRSGKPAAAAALVRVFVVFALLFVFLVGVNGLGKGFESLGGNILNSVFAATNDPFMALMIGILATSLVQSSSVTTAMIVACVAAPDNPLPLANAVPMVMGANIGTTVTNTVIALGFLGRKTELKRAFAVATCHDFFNFLAVTILLPLELVTGYLRHSAIALTSLLTGIGGVEYDSPLKGVLRAVLIPIQGTIGLVVESRQLQGLALIVLSGLMIVTALLLLVRVLRSALQTPIEKAISGVLGKNAVLSMCMGAVVTAMVQSSSITTSLLVPLGGAGLITLRQAFPVTIGANIGTTITALMAALAATGVNAASGVAIALVHLLFNLSGALLIYPVERIRELPLTAALWLAKRAAASRRWAFAYVVVLFYGLPTLFAILNNLME